MKKCPQCNTVYGDDVQYCLNDGTPLVQESFSMPSAGTPIATDDDEPDTIIRHEPIVIDLTNNEPPPTQAYYAPPPPPMPENVMVVPANSGAASRNYALFLLLGLVIGGGLVLATLLFSRIYYQNENSNTAKVNVNTANANQVAKVEKPTPSPTVSPSPTASVEPTPNKHAEPNEEFDGIANGKVIATNARVRLAPDKNSPVVDTLPMGDRLDIIRRSGPNSPWYQVECEHGTTGWMHGDTIEFFDQ